MRYRDRNSALPTPRLLRRRVFMTDANVSYCGSASATTSTSLLSRARANDREAWERVVYLYSPLVHGWCRRFGLQDADTLDVGQDVLRSVFLHLDSFRKDRPGDSFRKWLKTMTRNRVLDFLRRAGRTPAARGGSDVLDAAVDVSTDCVEYESSANRCEPRRFHAMAPCLPRVARRSPSAMSAPAKSRTPCRWLREPMPTVWPLVRTRS